jgi:hypothetical protein
MNSLRRRAQATSLRASYKLKGASESSAPLLPSLSPLSFAAFYFFDATNFARRLFCRAAAFL